MSENYTKVNVLMYVKEGIESGILVPFEAVKYARILAREGVVGEEIITMSVDENGEPIIEKTDEVKVDEKTGKVDMVVTKASEDGEPIVDTNGNINQRIMGFSKFIDKYEQFSGIAGFYKPKGGPQIFVQIPDNIILNQWGSDMKIAAGGFINITDVNDMYGISGRDFADTYKRTSADVKTYEIK